MTLRDVVITVSYDQPDYDVCVYMSLAARSCIKDLTNNYVALSS